MITLDKSVRAILFDIDGTLVNSETYHLQAFTELLKPFDIDCDEAFYKKHISGKANDDLHGLLPQLNHTQARAFFEQKESRFRNIAREKLTFTAGLSTFLQALQKANVTCALVSNAPRKNVEMVAQLMRAQISAANFSVSVSGEDVTAGKPNPEPYLRAMQQLGMSPAHCVAFEDSESGVLSSVRANVRTLGMTTSKSAEELLALGCSETLRDFSEVSVAL